MIPVRQSTAFETAIGPVLDADGVAVTGCVVGDFKIKKTTGNFAALNASTTLTHVSAGIYDLVLTTSDTDTVGLCCIAIDDTTNACASLYMQVMEEAVYDAMYAASAAGYQVPIWSSASATVSLTNTTVATVTTTTTATNVTTVNGLAANVITAAAIAADAIGASELAADAVAEIADAVWDELQSGHVGAGTFGEIATEIADILVDTSTTLQGELDGIQADTEDIQTRLPAALTADGNMKTDNLYEGGAVWFDTAGAAGTTAFTHGILTNPNSSMANSRTIANALGLFIFRIANDSTVTLDQGYTGFSFLGERWTLALASRAISNSYFKGATVSGLSTGTGAVFEHCSIGTVTIANSSTFVDCGVNGTFTCQAAGVYTFDSCHNNSAAGTDWVLDFAAVGATTIGLHHFAGSLEVRNMAAGDVLIFSGNGQLTIASSCTAGTVNIRGNVVLVNNGSGQTIADTSRWNEDQSLAAVTGAVGSVTGAVGSVTGNVGGNVTGSVGSVATGGIAAASFAAGAIDAAAIAANAIGASELAADAVAEIADAVWDEALSGHLSAGSTGEALNAAGSAGDPWTTSLPGAYTGSQAGKMLSDILTDTGTTLQAELDGIQADTEDIQTRLPAALVGGRIDANTSAIGGSTTPVTNIGIVFNTDFAANYNTTSDTWNVNLTHILGIASNGDPGYVGIDWGQVANQSAGVDLVNSAIAQVGTIAAGGIVTTSFAAGAIDASAIAADAGAEIGTAVWATTTRQLTGTQAFNLTGNITGNLSGSVGSVTGAVGSVTGNVGGNVVGSVASVTGAVGSVTATVSADVVSISSDSVAADNLESYLDGTNFMPVDAHKPIFSISGATLTVKKPDGTTTAYTRTLTTDAAADPVTGSS